MHHPIQENLAHEPQIPENNPLSAPIQPYRRRSVLSTRSALLAVVVIFVCSFFTLLLVYANFPNVTSEERQHIRLPWNIEQAKNLGIVLSKYKEQHYVPVLTGVFLTYILIPFLINIIRFSVSILLSSMLGLYMFSSRSHSLLSIVSTSG
ncbi:transmembrane protein 41B [Agrilus planipennis]|uniref:Transmembrane protein 41B n=1 Tax=Agrilus planipennis TaxID=224129 RepID=A0A7F5R2V5_AGRPL|nr:transmembrane protein 41B [Agrilus planipennis]